MNLLPSIQAVLFDLDGLLVDSEQAWYRARISLAAEFGCEWTEAEQRAQAGVHTDVWVENVRACIGGALSAEEVQERIVSNMESYYLAGEVPLLKGAEACVQHCNAHFKTALASGSPRRLIDAALTGARWQGVFDQVISSDEVASGKPAPDVYTEVLRQLRVEPSRALVLEDSGAGIRAGKAAGCFVVAVPNPETNPGPATLALADLILPSLDEIASLFPG
jgi:HAD superfamily hydrolase (TIGR01509 family)